MNTEKEKHMRKHEPNIKDLLLHQEFLQNCIADMTRYIHRKEGFFKFVNYLRNEGYTRFEIDTTFGIQTDYYWDNDEYRGEEE